MNLLSPGNFSPCDAGKETISNKSYTGQDNTLCDWYILSISLMLIFKTNETECNVKILTQCACTLRNTAVIDMVTQNIAGYFMNLWVFLLPLLS